MNQIGTSPGAPGSGKLKSEPPLLTTYRDRQAATTHSACEQAIEYFQKTSDDWPGYEHSAWALLKVAQYLEVMADEGLIDAEAAVPSITAVLRAVIDKYPQDGRAEQAQAMLDYYRRH